MLSLRPLYTAWSSDNQVLYYLCFSCWLCFIFLCMSMQGLVCYAWLYYQLSCCSIKVTVRLFAWCNREETLPGWAGFLLVPLCFYRWIQKLQIEFMCFPGVLWVSCHLATADNSVERMWSLRATCSLCFSLSCVLFHIFHIRILLEPFYCYFLTAHWAVKQLTVKKWNIINK